MVVVFGVLVVVILCGCLVLCWLFNIIVCMCSLEVFIVMVLLVVLGMVWFM